MITNDKKSDKKMFEILGFLQEHINNNSYAPSFREICFALNIKSTASIKYYFDKLEKLGYIRRIDNKNRCIELLMPYKENEKEKSGLINVPIVGKIAAGAPITAIENIEDNIKLSENVFKIRDSDTFIVTVCGDSMIDIGIFDGDLVLIRKQEIAYNGQIVAALTSDNEVTLKRFFKEKDFIRLKPENKNMQDILLTEVKILGIAIGLIRKNIY